MMSESARRIAWGVIGVVVIMLILGELAAVTNPDGIWNSLFQRLQILALAGLVLTIPGIAYVMENPLSFPPRNVLGYLIFLWQLHIFVLVRLMPKAIHPVTF